MIRKRRRRSHPEPEIHPEDTKHLKIYFRKLEWVLYWSEESEEDITEMDWINCNSCCRQPGDEKDRTFVLTSCGHIFCDLCLTKVGSKDKCGACSSQCQLIQLSSKMKPDAEMFFQEPATLLKRQYAQVNRLLEFQKDHRIRLVSFHRRIVQKYKSLEKQHSSAANQIQEMERRYNAATNRIHELEQENQRLRSLVSQDRGGGGGGTFSTQHDHQTRTLTPQIPSPKQQSPGGATRISPGRLTLVKTGSGTGQRGPISAPPGSGPSPMPPYGATAVTPSSSHYPHQGGSSGPLPPPPFHFLPHQPDHHTHPGAGYYRSYSPAQSRNPSPTSSRGSTGSINQQLSLLPPHHPHHHHPSPVHNPTTKPTSSSSASYPSASQQRLAPHHYSHPPQHHHQQPRLFPPNGTMSPNLTSSDPYGKSPTQNMGYKKYGMSFGT
ncbi:hypothetical protein Pmani_029804 [Petrolisthes manimaculis]|uniref:RING-type domain-containing protein n=1 Tax=Petrolisthes manimaculis TaxID=1843537 RepID=A0AAE1TWM4_9EUCA|nr:hypothetical protein Pmani_029804 [Petrolisthes manimaculis]